MIKKKRKKLPSIKRLRNKLDLLFNTYIKLRDKKCILSGGKEFLQCSHYYDKKNCPYLRWDERNAHAMTRIIHYKHHHGRAPDYALWMFSNHSKFYMSKLYEDSLKEFKPKRQDYINLINKYKEKIAALG